MSALSDALMHGITAQVQANSPQAQQEKQVVTDYLNSSKMDRVSKAKAGILEIEEALSKDGLSPATKTNLEKLSALMFELAAS